MDSAGGLLQTPTITQVVDGMGMKYTMTMATFNIKYNALDCGFGMGLIQSHGSSNGIKISRVSLTLKCEIFLTNQ